LLFSLDAEPARFTRRAVVVFPASVLSNTTMKNYPKQKFYEAVSALIGNSSIEMRLTYAAEPLLMLQPNELPEKMRHEFELLLNDLRQNPLVGKHKSCHGLLPKKRQENLPKGFWACTRN
jgi:hypothetical protein